MNKKYLKIMYLLSINCRTPLKEISRQIKSSQQSTSYLLKIIKKKYIRGFTTMVDAVKLGYTNIIMGLDYRTLDQEKRKEIMAYLNKNNSIISIQYASYGTDLILEYCCNNLSAFNKQHNDMLKIFQNEIKTRFVYPVIVKHKFRKNYLTKKMDYDDTILCGDRNLIKLTKNEKKIVNALVKNPTATFTKLAKITKISIKTIVKLKKNLENNNVIKKYNCYYNLANTNIKKEFLFLKPMDINDLGKLPEYAKNHKNVVEVIKIMGKYSIILVIESLDQINILKNIKKNFDIIDYRTIRIDKIIKENFLPLSED